MTRQALTTTCPLPTSLRTSHIRPKPFGLQALCGWARLVSNQRPLACEAVVLQALMGVVPRTWMCADVRRYARMCALSGTRTALVPNSNGAGGWTGVRPEVLSADGGMPAWMTLTAPGSGGRFAWKPKAGGRGASVKRAQDRRTATRWRTALMPMPLGIGVALIAALLIAVFSAAAQAAPGDLDPTFSGDGKQTTDFGGAGERANAVALQADGNIVAAGVGLGAYGTRDFALARYKGS